MLIEIILINVRIVVTFYIIKKYRTYSESLNIVFVHKNTICCSSNWELLDKNAVKNSKYSYIESHFLFCGFRLFKELKRLGLISPYFPSTSSYHWPSSH